MTKNKEDIQKIYQGLHALKKTNFPKTCKNCGKVYASLSDFINQTEPLQNSSGLKDYNVGIQIVSVLRNCSCQSTLIVPCHNRRDMSKAGQRKRNLFDKIFNTLKSKQINEKLVRQEIIKVLNGHSSELLENLGITKECLLNSDNLLKQPGE